MKNFFAAIIILLMVGLLISVVSLRRDVNSLPEDTARSVKDSLARQNKSEQVFRDSLRGILDSIEKKDWKEINYQITNKYETHIDHINNASDADIDSFFTVQMAGVGQRIN